MTKVQQGGSRGANLPFEEMRHASVVFLSACRLVLVKASIMLFKGFRDLVVCRVEAREVRMCVFCLQSRLRLGREI